MQKQEKKIRNYRAASLREALVQIKQELGDDALVIETKKVRAGGILGFGARNMVEVRVLPNTGPTAANKTGAKRPMESKPQARAGRINLRDASPAMPGRGEAEAVSSPTFAALAARAYRDQGREEQPARKQAAVTDPEPELLRLMREAAGASAPQQPRVRKPVDTVELAETAPRIVHPAPARSRAAGRNNGVAESSAENEAAGLPRNALSAELARLRAEMRELKFALGTFAARPGMHPVYGAPLEHESDLAQPGSPNHEIYLTLTATGLPPALAGEAIRRFLPPGAVALQDSMAAARELLIQALPSWVHFAETPVAVQSTIAFVGPTGVGKTTTIAKLAARIALRARKRVELITLDTYRIAAVQQLKTYAEIIGAGFHVARSLVELDAMTRRFAGQATVLIDTTGRSPHDLADQLEPADYLRGNASIMKCLVLPATLNPADAQIALNKFSLYGVNRLVLTKLDETVQPGIAVNIAALADLPLVYLASGQRVPEDLERATPKSLAGRVLKS